MSDVVVNKEMGFTHADFYRDIERVLGDVGFRKTDIGVLSEHDGKRLLIELSEQTERKIALIRLPVIHVTFTFSGHSEDDIKAFFELYDRVFRRGGG